MRPLLPAAALTLVLAACSPAADNATTSGNTVILDNGTPEAAPAVASASPTPAPSASATAAAGDVLTLEGLGPLRIGEALPAGSGWVKDPNCSAASSPAYPGVYAIVEQDKVRRITVQRQSKVKLIEGIGVGSTEQAVMAAFPGFRSEPHKYEPKPAKYLTAPNAASGDVALRFEIGTDGKVKAMHVGTMPALGYAEGCG